MFKLKCISIYLFILKLLHLTYIKMNWIVRRLFF